MGNTLEPLFGRVTSQAFDTMAQLAKQQRGMTGVQGHVNREGFEKTLKLHQIPAKEADIDSVFAVVPDLSFDVLKGDATAEFLRRRIISEDDLKAWRAIVKK